MKRFVGALCILTLTASLLGSTALIVQEARISRGLSSELPQPGLAPRPANLFGVNVQLLGDSPDEQSAVLDNIQAAGFGWIRQVFDWSTLEPEPDRFDWDGSDTLVDAATHRGLGIIAVLTNSPAWARTSSMGTYATAPPEDPRMFASFAGALAARYADQLQVYQVWDEPNLQLGWGSLEPSAVEYTRLLEAAHNAISDADPSATVMLAGLAPTTETGPQNVSDILFLRQLYYSGAGPYFDAVAGKPYGYNASHEDRTTDPDVMNFSRFVLLREEMERAGDDSKLLWASNFGWYNGEAASVSSDTWGSVTAQRQQVYTLGAYERAWREWPWAGVLVLDNYQPSGAPDDPRWGFSLVSSDDVPTSLMTVLLEGGERITDIGAPSGVHRADSTYVNYSGDWEFSELGADIPQSGEAEITFTFVGSELGIIARRANYRAYLYVEIDGMPANALPRDSNGEAYQVLTSPDLLSRVELLTLATGLSPGTHTARLRAERGWDQWAIVGFSTASVPDRRDISLSLAGFVTLAILSVVGLSYISRRTSVYLGATWIHNLLQSLSDHAHTFLTIGLAGLFWLSAWMAWGNDMTQLFRRNADVLPVMVTVLSASLFYYSPWLLLVLASVIALFIMFYVRPEIAIALIAFSAPFYLHPRLMFERVFSTVEIFTVIAAIAVSLHVLAKLSGRTADVKLNRLRWTSIDLAVVVFAFVSGLSIFTSDMPKAAFTEFRVIVFEPVLFYLMLRILPLNTKDIWRIVDFFVLGAVLVAAIGLYQYAAGFNLVAAEDGIMRLRSVYGSPNNVGLYLGRAIPVVAGVAILGRNSVRRRWYIGAAILMVTALMLSFSRGALLLGMPAAVAALVLFRGGRGAAKVLGGLAVAVFLSIIALGSNPRIEELTNLSTGPTFFRINLWRSTINMIRDHPVTGVGLDNFLYAYRSGYISPAAWQEPNLSHAHNWVLDYAARIGLPGLAVAVWLLVVFFRMALQAHGRISDPDMRSLLAGFVASMVNFLAHGVVDASYWFVDLAFAYMLAMGLIVRLGNMVQSESQVR